MRRKKIIKNVKIEAVAAEGKGLGRHQGKVVFVEYGIPGDVADVVLSRDKKDYAIGAISELVEPSPLRQKAVCGHFGTCGGCRWQHISYEQQLAFKESLVEEAFRRTGKQDGYSFLPIIGCDRIYGYRNKFEFTFSKQGWFTSEQIGSGEELERRALGFHVGGQYQKIVHVGHCHLQEDEGNAIRNAIYRHAIEKEMSFYDHFSKKGFLRNLTMRYASTGQRMILLSFGEDDGPSIKDMMDFISNKFPGIESVNYVVNTKLNDTIYDLQVVNHSGSDHIIERLGHTSFKIGPKSFFQTNTAQARILYDKAVEFAALDPSDTVYDLYTGTGSIALYAASSCRRVVGVETVPEAIEDAWKNAELNGTQNAVFVAGSAEKILRDEFLQEHGRPDVLITDPPRAGMHPDVVSFILRSAPKRIVYISCNPVTQARDIQMMSGAYKLVKLQPVDMFPHTYHIENIALLERQEDHR